VWASFGGRKILSRVELTPDHLTAYLLYMENLPGSAQVQVTFDGSGVIDFRGLPFDAEGDGQPGGKRVITFTTLSQSPRAGNIVVGRVFASELVIRSAGNTNISVNIPLAGVTVTADGLEESVRAVTDQFGNFRLTNAPAGKFFVHVDGRTVHRY